MQIVVVASQMDDSTERIISYLRTQYEMPINILFFKVYTFEGNRFISRAWYMDWIAIPASPSGSSSGDWNGEFHASYGTENEGRTWEDARKYGFISAGGGGWYTQTLSMLAVGDRVWVNIPHTGYVGVGCATVPAVMAKDAVFKVNGEEKRFFTLDLKEKYDSASDSEEVAEYIVQVEWIKTVPISEAAKETGFFGNQNSVCKPRTVKWQLTVEGLCALWGIK